ncbi:227 kDa spindle- and centromere-associated protein-like [Centruroides sculpturatus]|uniref:227 kDa spindle- and centromere-associated protein-like n=1 Tax=Centruroides sculpturatus TaxID=218467 RepID=UPI000C6DE3FE|nr:227 kDa spindle- and centromere-associated protein-like [Centruroides sculpturatus]
MEFVEDQQLLIAQLKELVRKNETELQAKNKELEDSHSKYQKLKLQSKAKIAQLTNQLKERNKISSVEETSAETTSDTIENNEQSQRGKVIMLKKQLEDVKQAFDKTEKELIADKTTLENQLRNLEVQLEDKENIIKSLKSELKSTNSEGNYKQDTYNVQELYAQMVYKDSKIMELNDLISEKERTIIDLQEHIKEKNEVLKTRNQAIQLMTEDLNRKGKSVIDQLDVTRDEMRLMQENFISKENEWKEENQQLKSQIELLEDKYNKLLQNKNDDVKTLEESVQKLEKVRFELATKNGELQEKLVRMHDESVNLKKEIESERTERNELKKTLKDIENQTDEKVLKARVKERIKFKALERELESAKKDSDSNQIASLNLRIAELEEEKGSLQLKLLEIEENSSLQMKEKYEEELLEENKYWKNILEEERKVALSVKAEKDKAVTELEEIKILQSSEKVGIEELRENLATFQKCYDELLLENACLHKNIDEKISELENKCVELEKFKEINLSLTEQQEIARMKLIEFEDKENQLMSFIQKYSCKNISDLQSKWEENVNKLNEMKTLIDKESNQSELHSLQMKELQEKENLHQKQINDLNLALEETSAENKHLKHLISEKDNLMADFEKRLHEKENTILELEEAKDLAAKLTTELNKMKIDMGEVVQRENNEKSELLKKLEFSEDNILRLKDQLNQYEILNANFQEELKCKNLENENQKLYFDTKLGENETLINSLNKDIEAFRNKWININNLFPNNNDKLSIEENITKLITENSKFNSDMQNLKQKLTDLYSNNKILEEELSVTKHENQSLKEICSNSESHIQELKTQMAFYNENISKYEKELIKLNQTNEELVSENNSFTETNKDLENKNNELSDKLNDMNMRYSEAILCNEEVEKEILIKATELNNSISKIEELEKQLHILNDKNLECEKEITLNKNVIDELKFNLNEKEQLYEKLKDTLIQKENEISEFNKLKAAYEQQTDELQRNKENLQVLQNEFHNTSSKLYEAEEKIKMTETSLQYLEEEKSNLIKQLETKDDDFKELIEKIEVMQQKNFNLENNLKLVIEETEQKSSNKFITELQDIQNKLETSYTLNRKLENELTTVNNLNKEYQFELTSLKKTVTDKNSEIENLKSANKEISEENNNLQDQLQQKLTENTTLLEEIELYKKNNMSSLEQISVLENNEAKLRESFTTLEGENQALSNLLKEMTEKSENLSSQLLQSVSCTNILQQELEELKYNFDNSKQLTEEKIMKSVEQNKLLEELNNSLETKIEKLQLEIEYKDAVITDLNTCKEELYELKIQFNKKEEEIELLNDQLKGLRKSSQCLQNDVERLQFFETEYHNLVGQHQKLEEEMNSKIKSMEITGAENENIITYLKSENDKLNKYLKEKSDELQNYTEIALKEKDSYQLEIKSLQEKLLSSDSSSEETKQNISELENSLKQSEKLLEEQKNDLEQSRKELEVYKNQTDVKIADLELMLKGKQAEYEVIQEQLKNIDDENSKLVQKIKDLENKNESLCENQKYLKSREENCDDLKNQLKAYKDQILELNENSERNIHALKADLQASNDQVQKLESKIKLLETDAESVGKLVEEISNLKQNIIDVNKCYEEEKLRVNKLQTILHEKELMVDDLKEKLTVLEEKNKSCSSQLLEFQKIVEDQASEIESIVLEKDEIKNKFENYQLKVEAEISNQTREIEELKSENLVGKEEIKSLIKKLESFEKENVDLKNYSEELQAGIKKHDEMALNYKLEADSLKVQYKELQSVNSSLNESVQTLLDEKEQQNALHELQNLNNALECELRNLRAEFYKLEEERSYLTNCVNESSRRIENLEFCNQKHVQENSAIMKEIEELKSKNYSLIQEIEQLNAINKESDKTAIESLKLEMEKYATENVELKRRIEELQNNDECENLKSQLKESEDKILLMEKEIKTRETQLEDLRIKLDSEKETNKNLSEIQDQLRESDKQRFDLENKMKKLEEEIENKDLELERLKNEYSILGNLFENYKKENFEIKTKEVEEVKISNIPLIEKETYQRSEADPNRQKLIKENETMKTNLDVQKIKLEKMFAKLKAFKEKNDQLQEEIQIFNEKLTFVEKEKENWEKMVTNKTEMISNLQQCIEENENLHRQEISTKENLIIELKERNSEIMEKCRQLEKSLTENKEITESIQVSLNKRNKEFEHLAKRLKEMDENQSLLEEKANNYVRQYNQLIYERECLQHEFLDAKQQMEMLVSDNEIFQGMVENLQKTKTSLESEVQRLKEHHIREVKIMQNANSQEIVKLKEMLQQSEMTICTLKKQMEEMETNENDERPDQSKVEEENSRLKKELIDLRNEVSSLKAFAAWDSDGESTRSTLEEERLREQNKVLQKDKELLEIELTSLKNDRCEFHTKLNDLKEKLTRRETEYSLKCQETGNVIGILNRQLNEAVEQNKLLSREFEERQKQWNDEVSLFLQKEDSLRYSIKSLQEELEKSRANNSNPANGDMPNECCIKNTDKLNKELEQAMYCLHRQSLRNESLSQEINKLIEERNTLQHQLSHYLRNVRPTEQIRQQNTLQMEMLDNVYSSQDTTSDLQMELKKLQERLERAEGEREEACRAGEKLEQQLETERSWRKRLERDLEMVGEETALRVSFPPGRECRLPIEDESEVVPATDYSIVRTVASRAHRLRLWIRRNRNRWYRTLRRTPTVKILLCVYLVAVHLWLLSCLLP